MPSSLTVERPLAGAAGSFDTAGDQAAALQDSLSGVAQAATIGEEVTEELADATESLGTSAAGAVPTIDTYESAISARNPCLHRSPGPRCTGNPRGAHAVYERRRTPGGPPEQQPDDGDPASTFICVTTENKRVSRESPAGEPLSDEKLTELLAESTGVTPEEIERRADELDIDPPTEATIVDE